MSEKALQSIQIALRHIAEFLCPRDIPVLKRFFRFKQVGFHAGLVGDHIAAQSKAGRALLLLQVIEAAVYRRGAVGKLVEFGLLFVKAGRIVAAAGAAIPLSPCGGAAASLAMPLLAPSAF